MCKKIKRALFWIKQAKNNLSPQALKALYYALVHSHLTYCPVILSCTSKNNINHIAKIQKKAVPIITYSRYNDHTALLFVNLDILPYEKILDMSKLMFMNSIEYNYSPSAFASTWQKNSDRNTRHVLRNENDYALPIPKIEFLKKITLYSLPAVFNAAGEIRHQHNRTTFKISLKYELLSEIVLDNVN
jgi:hypothetical protein